MLRRTRRKVRRQGQKRRDTRRVVVRSVEHLAVPHADVIVVRGHHDVVVGIAGSANRTNEVRALTVPAGSRREGERTLEPIADRHHTRLLETSGDVFASPLASRTADEPTLHVVGCQLLDIAEDLRGVDADLRGAAPEALPRRQVRPAPRLFSPKTSSFVLLPPVAGYT